MCREHALLILMSGSLFFVQTFYLHRGGVAQRQQQRRRCQGVDSRVLHARRIGEPLLPTSACSDACVNSQKRMSLAGIYEILIIYLFTL